MYMKFGGKGKMLNQFENMWPGGIEARERSLAKTQSFWPMRKMKAKFRNDAGRDRTEGASTIKTLSFYSETLATCRKTQTAALGAETTVFLAKTAMNSSIHKKKSRNCS